MFMCRADCVTHFISILRDIKTHHNNLCFTYRPVPQSTIFVFGISTPSISVHFHHITSHNSVLRPPQRRRDAHPHSVGVWEHTRRRGKGEGWLTPQSTLIRPDPLWCKLLCSTPLYFNLFQSNLLCSTPLYFTLFQSNLLCSTPLYSDLLHFTLFQSISIHFDPI